MFILFHTIGQSTLEPKNEHESSVGRASLLKLERKRTVDACTVVLAHRILLD